MPQGFIHCKCQKHPTHYRGTKTLLTADLSPEPPTRDFLTGAELQLSSI